MEIKIDKEFKELIPNIGVEEFLGLEESIKKEGCRDPLITWNNILLDGHNRYKICKDNEIQFKIKEIMFESKKDAKIWIINNQFGRRNLSPYQRGVLALKLEPLLKERAKENLSKGGQGSPILAKVDTRKEIAAQANISHGTLDKIKEIELKATNEQKEKLNQGVRTVSSVFKDIEQSEIRAGIKVPFPKGKFSVIYADPPWKYQWDARGAAAQHYNTEEVDDLKKFKVPAKEDCVLFMWATNPKLNEALELIEAWGFEYKTNIVWVKDKFGTGYWVRGQHELLLIATKGKVSTPPPNLRISSVINATRTKHSKKPEKIYEIIETMFPGMTYIEMFARNKRKNWESWGNEV